MAIAITLRGCNDLGRSVTPIFLSRGHFLYQFLSSRNLDFIAKRSIEFRSFDLFVWLCGSFKCSSKC